MFVTYQGDERFPDDTRPFTVPGFDEPLPKGEPVEVTDEFAQSHFGVTAKELVDRITTRYNSGFDTPRLKATVRAPSAEKAVVPATPSTDNAPPEPAKE